MHIMGCPFYLEKGCSHPATMAVEAAQKTAGELAIKKQLSAGYLLYYGQFLTSKRAKNERLKVGDARDDLDRGLVKLEVAIPKLPNAVDMASVNKHYELLSQSLLHYVDGPYDYSAEPIQCGVRGDMGMCSAWKGKEGLKSCGAAVGRLLGFKGI
jgi:hypothetical protein